MRRTQRNAIRHILATTLIAALAVIAPVGDVRSDDTQLFRTFVAPNVLFVFDISGSMNTVVYHSAYRADLVYDTVNCPYIADPNDPNYDPTCLQYPLCTIDDSDTALEASDFSWNGDGDQFRARATKTETRCDSTLSGNGYDDGAGSPKNVRVIFDDPEVTADGKLTAWPIHYFNWYFSDNVEVDHDSDGTTIKEEIEATANGARSQCLIDKGNAASYSLYRRSRLTAGKEVLSDVICDTNQVATFRYGLAVFDGSSDPEGSYVVVAPDDYSSAHVTALETALDGLVGGGYTPLAESLWNIYRFFMSRNTADLPLGKDTANSTVFPVYDIDTDGDSTSWGDSAASVGTIPGHPVTADCQSHFVIMISDGISTRDDFDNMDFSTFDTLIGDYAAEGDADETPANAVLAPDLKATSCSGNCEASLYLDDIAKFVHEHDFMLDAAFPGVQTLDFYTVGFSTSAKASALLTSAANLGGGKAFISDNAEELAASIDAALAEIESKVQAFSAATVPANRTSVGNHLYYSYFIPQGDDAFWEGHLKDFDFTIGGDVLDGSGNCAVGTDPNATAPCPVAGKIRETADGHWDAADEIPDPGSRTLFYGDGGTLIFAEPPTWDTTNIDAVDLGPAFPTTPFAVPYDLAADQEDLADKLVKAFSGCEFGTDCTIRTNDDGDRMLLGDVFHGNPIVVGSPNSAINEPTYRDFTTTYRGRDRVVYAAVNDGFLHAFHAGDFHIWVNDDGVTPLIPPRYDEGTGLELFAFMPSEIRRTLWTKLLVGEDDEYSGDDVGPDHYTVDAPPVAADVWMYRDFGNGAALLPIAVKEDKVEEQWRTVIMGGLREGGRSYYALDATNPAAVTYPGYLWEFPCDTCGSAENPSSASWASYMGQTWSEPVITKVRVASDTGSDPRGYERWVAVFGAGYDTRGNPNHADYEWDPAAVSQPRGRAIFMVDITTGEVLAVKHWSASATNVSGTQIGFPEMRYAVASAPAVFDIDFDGFADVIYIGDLGGNMWKWTVSAIGDDPINNSTSDDNEAQPNWPFRLFFRGFAGDASADIDPPPNHDSVTPTAPAAGTHFQSFFFPPTGVLRSRNLVIAFGAGERADADSFENDGAVTNNNHLYVVRDTDPYEYLFGSIDPITDRIDEDDLAKNSDLNDVNFDCSALYATSKGYMLDGRDAEKFTTNSVIFQGELITGSFIPPDPNSTDPCTSAGTGYLYRFNIDCGTGGYPGNSGGPDETRRKALGGGLPTRPRVSVGAFNQGGNNGNCDNRVVVITSDGSIDNDCAGPLPSLGTKIRSWRME